MNKKILIIILASLLLVAGVGTYFYLTNEDKNTSLNVIEKKWIDNNKKELQDISIYTNVPVFSYNGEGIVFDFLKSLESNTELEFNKISYTIGGTIKTDYAFMETNEVGSNDILMYEDNYVLVTKNGVYNKPTEIKGITVGVLDGTMDTVSNYLLGSDITYKTFTDYKVMLNAIGTEVDGAVIPKIEYLADVLQTQGLSLSYNISEYKTYYVIRLSNNANYSTLNSILTKYYKRWSKDNFDKAFNTYLLNNYFTVVENGSTNIAKLKSKRYVYGFVSNPPYDILVDGKLSGINNTILSEYARVTGVSVEYKEYDDMQSLINAFNKNEIDFYFNINKEADYKIDVSRVKPAFEENIVVLTKNKDNMIVNSVNSLKNTTVGVLKGSLIADYLTSYKISIKEYDTIKSLMKDNKVSVKAIDEYNYNYYISKSIKKYHRSYSTSILNDYGYIFRDISDNRDFRKFLSFYLSFTGTTLLVGNGISDAVNVNVTLVVLRYTAIVLSILITIALIACLIYKYRHRRIKSNLTKEDKLKYIDMLTSLKNRNYLNDNIEIWDESEVYPQTIIIVDLNNIAYINDNYGHAEGDSVIKEAANILIRNQLENSEIIRTNGNEFLIYLVSADEKQVVSYVKKMNKELKELAHGFGAAIGYSIINDAIKTIDDAINEATIDMKTNKEELSKD